MNLNCTPDHVVRKLVKIHSSCSSCPSWFLHRPAERASPLQPAATGRWQRINHEGHEEHEGGRKETDYSTKRLTPSFSLVTLKLINNPIFTSANFMYVNSCA